MPAIRRGRARGRLDPVVERPARQTVPVNYVEAVDSDSSPERGDLSSGEEDVINAGRDPYLQDR